MSRLDMKPYIYMLLSLECELLIYNIICKPIFTFNEAIGTVDSTYIYIQAIGTTHFFTPYVFSHEYSYPLLYPFRVTTIGRSMLLFETHAG